MTLTKKQEYWADIAFHFIKAKHKVSKIGDESQHPYLDKGINVGGQFNLGTLISDNFFECRSKELGEPESDRFSSFVSRLSQDDVVRQLTQYNSVILTQEPSLSVDGIEFFEGDKCLDRMLLVDIDYLMKASSVAQDIKKISQRLAEARKDQSRHHDAPYRAGQKMIHVVSEDRARPIDIWSRIERVCYESIPNLKQRENEFRMFQIGLLRLMGLNIEDGSPWNRAVNAAFAGVIEPGKHDMPFDAVSYMFLGGRDRLFTGHLIGQDILGTFEPVYFEIPKGEDASKTKYERRRFFSIPWVLYAVAGNQAGDETKGVYVEVNLAGLGRKERAEILKRALDIYQPLVFGEAYFHRKNLKYIYKSVMEDMEWVIATLDHTKLDGDKILHGSIAEENRKLPVYGEGYDEYGYPAVERHEVRPVKFFQAGDGKKYNFYDFSELDLDNIKVGTLAKALMRHNTVMSYHVDAVAPFQIGE